MISMSKTSIFMVICIAVIFNTGTHAQDVSNPVCKWNYSTNTCEKDPSKMIQLLTNTNEMFALLMRCQYATTQSTCNNMSNNTCIWENNACHISSKILTNQISNCFQKNKDQNEINQCKNELRSISENTTWINKNSVRPASSCKQTVGNFSSSQDTCIIMQYTLYCTSSNDHGCRYGSNDMQAYQLVSDLRYIMGVSIFNVSSSLYFLENYLDIESGNLQLYDVCSNITKRYKCQCKTTSYYQSQCQYNQYASSARTYQSSTSTNLPNSNNHQDKKDIIDIIIIVVVSLLGLIMVSICTCATIFRENAQNATSGINETSQNVEITARTTNEEDVMVTAVTVDILERLHKQEFKVQNGHETSEFICCICLDKLQEGDVSTALECGHCFHKNCLEEWIKTRGRNVSCPLCNKTLQNTQQSQQ